MSGYRRIGVSASSLGDLAVSCSGIRGEPVKHAKFSRMRPHADTSLRCGRIIIRIYSNPRCTN